MTDEITFEKKLSGLCFLLGSAMSMLFEMQEKMTPNQIRFWQWWKDSMYEVAYKDKPVPIFKMPEKGFTND
jgi:hypothetical protein